MVILCRETDIDNVLQVPYVFTNVSKVKLLASRLIHTLSLRLESTQFQGQVAKDEDVKKVLGMPNNEEACKEVSRQSLVPVLLLSLPLFEGLLIIAVTAKRRFYEKESSKCRKRKGERS